MQPAGSDFAPFRPRSTRIVTTILAVGVLVSFCALSIALYAMHWNAFTEVDLVWMNGLGVLFALILLRFGAIAAFPDAQGIKIRNLATSRYLQWEEIIGVSFARDGGDPWPQLDLSNGLTHGIMAIQHADGTRAYEEVARLRMLVSTYGTA